MILKELFNDRLLSRFVIDDAHCVSNLSHDFRPTYLGLKQLKTIFPKVQIVSFTAMTTPRVQTDIVLQLGLKTVYMHRQSSIRSNLSYQIHLKNKRTIVHEMASLIRGRYRDQSGIIYCLNRQSCEELTGQLAELGVSVGYFHTGLNPIIKDQVQDHWIRNEIQAIVVTFGTTIVKSDIRFVFHHTLPISLEEYYQETG